MSDPKAIVQRLRKLYPNAECSLHYKSPFQLLAATILSAQCTDERVNKVTPILFAKFPDAESLAKASQAEIEQIIQSTGFFRAKAKSLCGMAKTLVEKYKGEVPQSIEELIQLPGVGRKTANVVLGNAFHKPAGIVVDTHVKRLAFRMGLTRNKDPEKVEADLNRLFSPKLWTEIPHWLIQHGRRVCTARSPDCAHCPLFQVSRGGGLCPRKGLPKLKIASTNLKHNVNVKKNGVRWKDLAES